jgi:hypothetical protein
MFSASRTDRRRIGRHARSPSSWFCDFFIPIPPTIR